MKRFSFFLLAVTACGGKQAKTAPTPPATPASAALLATGETTAGCFAWSDSAKAAACIVGSRITGKAPHLGISFMGGNGGSPTELPGTIDDATAATVNAALQKDGYAPIGGTAQPVAAGSPLEVDKGLGVTFDEKPESKTVMVSCGDKQTEALSIVGPGRTATVTARAFEGHVAIEMTVDVNLADNKGRAFYAAIVDTSTCESVEGAI